MSHSYSDSPSRCSTDSAELKLYQAFIFSVPIFFTFILLLLFYLFYLRRQRVDWSSLRMRTSYQNREAISMLSESGLKKEFREMLPIIVFRESFSIKDTLCSVCLGDYQAEDRLQQIPACGHTFHMDCIDHWLATHTTCPLCRLSLVPVAKMPTELPDSQVEAQSEEAQSNQGSSEVSLQRVAERDMGRERNSHCARSEEKFRDGRKEVEGCGFSGNGSVVIDVETDSTVEQEGMREHP
ncbi:hypothetical protein HHK36_008911 [Tetracentron sinense]|uniref:RING-type E3 ubiquitin transferase n=1 Tax=Tetracentron sinense TaxID=13715 RepID=A0A834ZEA9_TETSI|nr:hypothetical protein HHK36_008911 [Tetracentron sinense]